jgi:membrane protease YdiL (CAAX protease family)
VYERTGSLWSAILVHMAFNAVQVTLTLGGV